MCGAVQIFTCKGHGICGTILPFSFYSSAVVTCTSQAPFFLNLQSTVKMEIKITIINENFTPVFSLN